MNNYGPIETRVRNDVLKLKLQGAFVQSLCEIAYNMAQKLDLDAGMATAAVGKQLTDILAKIEEAADDSDDRNDLQRDISTPQLSPEMGDWKNTKPSDLWTRSSANSS